MTETELQDLKTKLLADADFVGKFLEQVASKARPVVVADVKAFAVAVLKKVGVYGPYVLGALGTVAHFVLGVL